MSSTVRSSHDTVLKSLDCQLNSYSDMLLAEQLSQMPNDCDRMKKTLLKVGNVNMPEPEHDQKSVKRADYLRQQGNQFLSVNNDRTLALYTESIAHAPTNSTALPFGYANRAVVLAAMGETMSAIADNQRAILTGYPESLQYKVLARLSKCYETLGQYGKSLTCLNAALTGVETSELSEEAKEKFVMGHIQPTLDACHTAGQEDEEELWNWTSEPTIGVFKLDVPSLGNNFNPELPSAAKSVALKYSKKFGRHLVATKDIEFGEILLVDNPYAAVLMESSFYTHCSHCLIRSRTLQPCPTCSWAMFCSGKCMSEAEVYHKLECRYIPRILELDPNSEENCSYMLAARVITRHGFDFISSFLASHKPANFKSDEERRKAGFNKDGKYISSDINTIANLTCHPITTHFRMMHMLNKTAKLMKFMRFDKLDCSYELGGFLYRFFSNSGVNGGSVIKEYILRDKDEDNAFNFFGICICPTYSLVNQNCIGNTFSHYYGQTLVLRAFRSIKAGEQIFIVKAANHYLKLPLEKRARLCSEFWYFTCTCQACVEKWPLEDDTPLMPFISLPQDYDFAMAFNWLNCLDDLEETPQNLAKLKKVLKVFDRSTKYQRCSHYFKMLNALRAYYVKEGSRVSRNTHFPKESIVFTIYKKN